MYVYLQVETKIVLNSCRPLSVSPSEYKSFVCCLCQGNVGYSSCSFRYGCSEVDMPLDSMGRWRHTRAALPMLQASWMLASSGPEAADLGLHDLPSLIDPAFQGNYTCERGHLLCVRLCRSTAVALVLSCVHPVWSSAGAHSA